MSLSVTTKATPQSPASHGVSSSSVPAFFHVGWLLVQIVLTQEGTPSDMRKAKGQPRKSGRSSSKNPKAPRMSDVKQQPYLCRVAVVPEPPASVKAGHLAGKTRESCQLLLVQNGGSMGCFPHPFGTEPDTSCKASFGEFCSGLSAEPTGHKSSCPGRPAVMFPALLSAANRLDADDDDDAAKYPHLHNRFWQVQSTVDQVEAKARCRVSCGRVLAVN